MKKIILSLLFSLAFLFVKAQLTDSIIDIRDGQIYKVVKIGEQWWMQENLNIGTMIDSIQNAADDGIIEKYCYHNSDSLCNIYGGLYQWSEMMDYNPTDNRNPGITRGACPVGWHLPSDSEWTELTDFLGGESVAGGKLKEAGTSHWQSPNAGATNESGFIGLPGGWRFFLNGNFYLMDVYTYFWSSSESTSNYAFYRLLDNNQSRVERDNLNEAYGFSVRCVRDSNQFSYLTISDLNFKAVKILNLYGDNVSEESIIINSSAEKTINILSISTKNPAFNLNYSSAALLSGDSIHLTVSFNPPVKDIYSDTVFIESDDPYNSLIAIPLNGTFPPEISFTKADNISCYGYSDGSATITPSLGTPPYYYLWDNPENTTDSIVTDLKANIYYHVVVTDQHGYTITDSIILSEPEKLKLFPHYSDTICLNRNDGFINLNPTGLTPPYTYGWSNGEDSKNITNLSPGDYNVKITDSRECADSFDFFINSLIPFQQEKVCIVTVDLLTGKNLIIWEKTSGKGIAYYNIYRERNLVGTAGYEDLSILKDTEANPKQRPYLYKLSVIDTCGNESTLSPYHKPIFLQYVSSINGVNLTWSKYEIEGETLNFDSYCVYRGSDSTSLSILEENIPTEINVFTDDNPNALARRYYYRIAGVLTNPCYPTAGKKADSGPYSQSMSNIEDNRVLVGMKKYLKTSTSISIIPNPFNDKSIIQFPNSQNYSYDLVIMDLTGKVVRVVGKIIDSSYELNKDGLPAGLYLIELRGPNIYRGKIIIE